MKLYYKKKKSMEEKIKAIYYIKDLRNDRIIYIGQTNDFKRS